MSDSIFGYFDRADQPKPTYDPGLGVLCPFCLTKLGVPVRTTSLMLPSDNRSFFYRAHRTCAETATETQVTEVESSLIVSRVNGAVGGSRDVDK